MKLTWEWVTLICIFGSIALISAAVLFGINMEHKATKRVEEDRWERDEKRIRAMRALEESKRERIVEPR